MFMTPAVTYDTFVIVDTNCGGYSFPSDLVGKDLLTRLADKETILTGEEQATLLQYTAGFTFFSAEVQTGYFSRMSASGYLDCTDWNGPYSTLYETVWDLFMNYFDESENEDWLEFLDACSSKLTHEQYVELYESFIGEFDHGMDYESEGV